MALLRYSLVRGQTIDIPLEDDGAVEGESDLIIAGMKKLEPGREDVDEGSPVSASLAAIYREATSSVAKGWNLHMDSTESADLEVADYLLDAVRATKTKFPKGGKK